MHLCIAASYLSAMSEEPDLDHVAKMLTCVVGCVPLFNLLVYYELIIKTDKFLDPPKRDEPCPVCNGDTFIYAADSLIVDCPTCTTTL